MDPILYGLIITLFGTITVFLVLIGLWGILALMRPLFGGRKKQNNVKAAEEINLNSASAQIASTNSNSDDLDSDELIAVIAAAINACMGTQSNLVVRKITRVGDSTPIWGQIGRHEQMLSRL